MTSHWSWTQPCCLSCWSWRNGPRAPHLLTETEVEICVYCGCETRDGIYIRIDPTLAPHPTLTKG